MLYCGPNESPISVFHIIVRFLTAVLWSNSNSPTWQCAFRDGEIGKCEYVSRHDCDFGVSSSMHSTSRFVSVHFHQVMHTGTPLRISIDGFKIFGRKMNSPISLSLQSRNMSSIGIF